MNILFIGDVFGRPGRETVKKVLPALRLEHSIDLVVANAENMHHGKGVSDKQIQELKGCGVDFFTSGNHVWKVNSIYEYLDKTDYPLIRPANYPESVPGRGEQVVNLKDGRKVLVINLMGRVFMHQNIDCPFRKADEIMEKYKDQKMDAILVDFHAEASSEKTALANYLDGKISVLVGTHTHVPTADERILPKGTAYQSDAGMTGPYDSIIGLEKESIIQNFIDQLPVKHEVAEGPTVFNATLFKIADDGLHAINALRIQKYFNEI